MLMALVSYLESKEVLADFARTLSGWPGQSPAKVAHFGII
jgi:hypothetical protein